MIENILSGLKTSSKDSIIDAINEVNEKASKIDNLAEATDSQLGVVKVGQHIEVSAGVISVPEASSDTYGVVKLVNNLDSESDNSALAASQGKVINEKIEGLKESLGSSQPLSTVKEEMDTYGTYRIIKKQDAEGVTMISSELYGGNAPYYEKRKVTTYANDGVTIKNEVTYSISYDINGNILNEVISND